MGGPSCSTIGTFRVFSCSAIARKGKLSMITGIFPSMMRFDVSASSRSRFSSTVPHCGPNMSHRCGIALSALPVRNLRLKDQDAPRGASFLRASNYSFLVSGSILELSGASRQIADCAVFPFRVRHLSITGAGILLEPLQMLATKYGGPLCQDQNQPSIS